MITITYDKFENCKFITGNLHLLITITPGLLARSSNYL